VYASANPGCLVQVATALRRAGSPLPALHPIELVDASIRNVGAAGLLRSSRR
jgi:glycolate oxidase iron-sulfur subunit